MFIVIEGIDGAGCETQAQNLIKMLGGAKQPASFIKYPDYTKNVGKLIREFLYQNKDLSGEAQFLLYTLQFILDKDKILHERKKSILIADRYFSTTLCFQTLEGVDLEKAVRFAKDFHIEKPDTVFYLDVRPEIAIKRKYGEEKEKNRRENDHSFIYKTYDQYKKLIQKQVWAKWVRINGEQTIDEVTKEIFNYLK